jgi:hypothetical protein
MPLDRNSRKSLLPVAEQMNDVDGNGAERAEFKADVDQAKHDHRVHSRNRVRSPPRARVTQIRAYSRAFLAYVRMGSADDGYNELLGMAGRSLARRTWCA